MHKENSSQCFQAQRSLASCLNSVLALLSQWNFWFAIPVQNASELLPYVVIALLLVHLPHPPPHTPPPFYSLLCFPISAHMLILDHITLLLRSHSQIFPHFHVISSAGFTISSASYTQSLCQSLLQHCGTGQSGSDRFPGTANPFGELRIKQAPQAGNLPLQLLLPGLITPMRKKFLPGEFSTRSLW